MPFLSHAGIIPVLDAAFTLVPFQTIALSPCPIPSSRPVTPFPHLSLLSTHSRTRTLRSPPPTRPSGGQWGRGAGPGAGTGDKDKDRGRARGSRQGHGKGSGSGIGIRTGMGSPRYLPPAPPSARGPRARAVGGSGGARAPRGARFVW